VFLKRVDVLNKYKHIDKYLVIKHLKTINVKAINVERINVGELYLNSKIVKVMEMIRLIIVSNNLVF
jgi:hypothetical protein